MQDVDIRRYLKLIPTRHFVIAFAGAFPLGLGLMGLFSPPAGGSLGWTGDYAIELTIFGAILGLPLYYSSARAGLTVRREMDSGADR